MDKTVLLFFAIFAACPVFSQVINYSGDHSLMLVTTKEHSRLNSVEGSPYLDNAFQYGTAIVEGKQPLKVFMRYNVHEEQIEIKTDVNSEDIYLLPKMESTVYKLGPQTFILDLIVLNGKRISGYFIEHYHGENFRLLEKPVTTITEAVKAKTGYEQDKPARIVIEEEYYIVNNVGKIQNVRLKNRDIKKTFNSPQAKKYLSDNRIRSEEDLVAFISFLDNQ